MSQKKLSKKYQVAQYYCCLFDCFQNNILGDDGGDDEDGGNDDGRDDDAGDDNDDGGEDDEGCKIYILLF